jgi:branched-chain amino acid transport system substrate-binding protein
VGMYHSAPDLSPEALGPLYKEFQDKYQKKYGERPLASFHAHAYDAAMMIFNAIEKVAKKDGAGNTYIGRKALRDALFATRDHKGLTGTLTCEQHGDCADPKIAVYQTESADADKWDPGTNPRKVYP